MIKSIQNTVYGIGTFIYETPIKVAFFAVAGIACKIFNHQFASPLLTVACVATLTRIAAKVIEKSYFQLSIPINSKMQEIHLAYGSLYYPVFIITMAAHMIIPLIGRIMAFCFGIYQGMMTEIQILQLKYNARVDHSGAETALPMRWMGVF